MFAQVSFWFSAITESSSSADGHEENKHCTVKRLLQEHLLCDTHVFPNFLCQQFLPIKM